MDGVDHEWEYHQDQRDQMAAAGGYFALALGIIALGLLVCIGVAIGRILYESAYDVVVGIMSMLVYTATTTV